MNRQVPMLGTDAPQPASAPLIPAVYAQSTISWSQITSILRAHRRQATAIFLALLAASLVIVKLLPKSYTAQATVLVSFELNEGNRQPPPDMFTSYLLTQVELIQSRDVLRPVIDRFGLTRDPEYTDGFKDDGVATLGDWVEKQLRESLSVEPGKGIQLIYVSVTSKDRVKAANIANAIVETYQARERNHSADPSSGRSHEYSEQLADLKGKVTVAEQRMAEFRNRTGITDINAQNDVESQALASLQQQLLVAQNERRAAESKSGGDRGASDQVMGSLLVQNLKNQVSTLQAQLAEASATLGPRHPKVMELQSQIAAARRSLDHEIQSFTQNSSVQVSSAQQLEYKLKHALDEQREKLVKTRELQDEGRKLQLELESAQAVYKRVLDSYDQVMFASSSFASRAAPPVESSKPNKVLLVVIGTLLAILAGIAGPLVYELLFNRRIHCRDDFERELGLPVLAEFDAVPAESGLA